MRVPGWKTALRAGRWARSRVTGAALILGYHRVIEAHRDPYELCVSPRHFAEQMEVLRTSARPTALAHLVDGLERGAAIRGKVAVTFDDGYADFARHAEPVLQQHEIPATVFVVSGSMGRRLWWDELAQLVLDSPSAAKVIDTVLTSINGSSAQPALDRSGRSPDRILATLHQWLLGCGVQTREAFLARLRTLNEGPTIENSRDDVIAEDDLARLSRSGLIAIGSHTVNHVSLAGVPEHEQLYELSESRRQLETITGQPVRDLSYPHGSQGAATRRIVRQTGYRAACASTPDAVAHNGDPCCLPRFWIPDWDGERFARWLHRWQT